MTVLTLLQQFPVPNMLITIRESEYGGTNVEMSQLKFKLKSIGPHILPIHGLSI